MWCRSRVEPPVAPVLNPPMLGLFFGPCHATDVLSDVRYARSGDVNVAYRVWGDGPFDVVFVPGTTSHVDFVTDVPGFRAILEELASFSRLIFFDKRGTGLSDPVDAGTPLEVRMDDVRAVMDAAGSERAAVMGVSEGGPMSILFAATYPERAWALVLYGTYARELWAHDYPWGTPEAEYRSLLETLPTRAARPERFEERARSGCPSGTEEEIAALTRYLRIGGSLAAQVALARMNMGIDVRDVLGAIRIPALVLHCTRDPWVTIEQARYLAERIPGSTIAELDCNTHIPAEAGVPMIVDPVRPFLQRAWNNRVDEADEPDRVLATVLFTDIVGSSEHAATLGDRVWREKLEEHHELVRRHLLRYRGVEVDTAGDGFFASFDGPARAIRCASAITLGVRDLGLAVRAGLHTGECELVDGKVAGIAVHTGARVASQARPGEVLVSSTVKDLVAGSGIAFEDRGISELRGIPGEWRLFAVAPDEASGSPSQ
jgi:class 3 adenylate cyclase/pimeloyl-ACP methyl ester carboxylesterase